MVELVGLALPTIVYCLLTRRRAGFAAALRRCGIAWGTPRGYAAAAVVAPVLLLLGWASLRAVPAAVLTLPGVVAPTAPAALPGVLLRALGEEVFFRGLLGGLLVRRLGFARGNTLQALLFFLPHLGLLLVDARLWPILPVQLVAGWVLGWVRHRAGSVLPGALAHGLTNALAPLLV